MRRETFARPLILAAAAARGVASLRVPQRHVWRARLSASPCRRDVRKAAISEEKWLRWQRPGTGQEAFVQAGRHSPCMVWRRDCENDCMESAARCVRIILPPRSKLPLLNCSHLATGCAFRVCVSPSTCAPTPRNINTACAGRGRQVIPPFAVGTRCMTRVFLSSKQRLQRVFYLNLQRRHVAFMRAAAAEHHNFHTLLSPLARPV